MDGSALAVIVIPIVTSISLAAWLIMVFYADGHPGWARPPGRRSSGPAAPADGRTDEARAVTPAGPERHHTPANTCAGEPVAAAKARPAASSFREKDDTGVRRLSRCGRRTDALGAPADRGGREADE
jgi:hypothetical protein